MTAPRPQLGTAVRVLLRHTIDAYHDSPQAVGWLQHNLDRFDEPLRVAIAGKVKAGKSTLLNALVGEEIAPTDAGECTRIVTWYRDAPVPRVMMFPRQAAPRQLTIHRDHGALAFDLAGTPVEQVERLEVQWPSQSLRTRTLIDTPGIASLSVDTSGRAGAFLAPEDAPSQADAVIYLMRHLHATDVHFLESFYDQGVARATPINTIAVLSRADEIGVGRLDALTSARRIARRYRADDKIRGLCQTVVAVAGLLAQTGRTMRQHEFTALTALAALPRADLEAMLLSVDRFSRTELAAPDSEARARLMERFGLFGVRLSTTLIRQGMTDPNTIAAELVRRSGLDELRSVLATQFTERRDLLKARSALLAIDLVLTREPRAAAAPLAAEVERILAGAHEFAELRLLSTIRAGVIKLPPEVLDEAERLLGGEGGAAATRLGLDPGAGPDELRGAALDAVTRWQRRAESPMSSRAVSDVARLVARSCEACWPGPPEPAAALNWLLLHLVAVAVLTGVGWVAQVVVYPAFALVGEAQWPEYHRRHEQAITAVVLLPWAGQAVSTAALLLGGPTLPVVVLAGLGVVTVVLTVAGAVPAHRRLAGGREPADLRALLRANRWRTLAWTASTGVAAAAAAGVG